jgi:hypothetical protein
MATFEGLEYEIDHRGRPVWQRAYFDHLCKIAEGVNYRQERMGVLAPKELDMYGRCWQWTGATTNGTPVMRDHPPVEGGRGRLCQARRLVYHWLVGPILPGRKVRDFCGNPMCVNPNHLRLGYPGRKRAEVSQ